MPLTSFYQTMTELCFTLLGLWWVVVQTRHRRWVETPERRRAVIHISLYFLLPGSMGLLAALAAEELALWRVAFALASVVGLAETVVVRARVMHPPGWGLLGLIRWLAAPLYGLVLLLALLPGLAWLFGATPLTAAGTLLALLVILGASLALAYFVEPGDGAASDE